MGHGHAHAPTTAAAGQRRRLAVVLGLTLAVLVAEAVGAALTGSLALLADAGHMATDAAGIALALGAVTLAQRPATRTAHLRLAAAGDPGRGGQRAPAHRASPGSCSCRRSGGSGTRRRSTPVPCS